MTSKQKIIRLIKQRSATLSSKSKAVESSSDDDGQMSENNKVRDPLFSGDSACNSVQLFNEIAGINASQLRSIMFFNEKNSLVVKKNREIARVHEDLQYDYLLEAVNEIIDKAVALRAAQNKSAKDGRALIVAQFDLLKSDAVRKVKPISVAGAKKGGSPRLSLADVSDDESLADVSDDEGQRTAELSDKHHPGASLPLPSLPMRTSLAKKHAEPDDSDEQEEGHTPYRAASVAKAARTLAALPKNDAPSPPGALGCSRAGSLVDTYEDYDDVSRTKCVVASRHGKGEG